MWAIKRMSRALIALIMVALLISGVGFFIQLSTENAKASIITVDDDGSAMFTSIQAAIDFADVGDTVYVHNGMYSENLIITRSVNLVGGDNNETIINGSYASNTIFIDGVDLVTISGFNITGGNFSGIFINSSSNIIISRNNIYRNSNGITINLSNGITITGNRIQKNTFFADLFYTPQPPEQVGIGVFLNYSEHNWIMKNNISQNGYLLCDSLMPGCLFWTSGGAGVRLVNSENISIASNDIFLNYFKEQSYPITGTGAGIALDSSRSNSVTNNNLGNGFLNIMLEYCSHNIISGNIAARGGIKVESSSNNTLSSNNLTEFGSIAIGSGSNNRIIGNHISNTPNGIDVWSRNNVIANNTIRHSEYGIYLYEPSFRNIIDNNEITGLNTASTYGIYFAVSNIRNNSISNNTISNNNYGIYLNDNRNNTILWNNITSNNFGISIFSAAPLFWSNNNTIYYNNFLGNPIQATDMDSDNSWNSSYPPAGIGGNYWSDYSPACQDLYDGAITPQTSGSPDGFCDNPYMIDGDSGDYYPLTTSIGNAGANIPPDDVAPARITDLTAIYPTYNSIQLRWTAPGDDDEIGKASEYDIRYSTSPINDTNWDSATQVLGEPAPKIGGQTEFFEIQGLTIDTAYYFAVKSADEVPNWSVLSNVATGSTLADTTPPSITNVNIDPNPQSVNAFTNISATVVDDFQLSDVWVNITYPDATYLNQSMDNIGSEYYLNQSYNLIGTYAFTIWANDSFDNWARETGQFLIVDLEAPLISNLAVDPFPQEVFGFVNVSATITDNYDVPTAFLAIKRPDNSSENVTMLISGSSYSYNQSYGQVGIYEFTIWANDTSGNWNLATGDINTTDSTPPSADAGQDRTIPQGTTIVLDGSNSWDNYLIKNYSWSLFDIVPIVLYGDQPFYAFNNIGNYEITITVVDSTGNSDTDTVWVNVTDAEKPEISDLVIDPIAQEVFGNVNISASIIDNYDVPTASIAVKFPDSTETNVSMLNIGSTYYLDNSFDALGVYAFTIWANDSSGNFDFATGFFVIIDITNPIADGGADIAISIGSTVTFDGSGSSDNLGISNYSWSFFDSGQIELFGISPSFTFASSGDFLIILKVKDASGNSDIDTLWVNVTSPVQSTGVIKGLVVDENGDPITGATIRLLLSGTVLNSTTTNSSGRYIFSGLGFGAYSIEVSARNQTVSHDDLDLSSVDPTINLITMIGPEQISDPPPKDVIPLWMLMLIGILIFVIIILLIFFLKERGKRDEVEGEENLEDSIMVEDEEPEVEKIED